MSATSAEAARAYDRELHRYLMRQMRTHPHDVDDVAQDIYLRLLASKDHAIDNPLAYLYGIAKHVLSDYRTDEQARCGCVITDSEMADEWADDPGNVLPDDIADRLSLKQQLDAALATLTPRQRDVILLHKRDGWSYDEIAALMNISWETVSRHIVDAKTRLRPMFPEESNEGTRSSVTTKGARYFEDSVCLRAEAKRRAAELRTAGYWASVIRLSHGMAKVMRRRRAAK